MFLPRYKSIALEAAFFLAVCLVCLVNSAGLIFIPCRGEFAVRAKASAQSRLKVNNK